MYCQKIKITFIFILFMSVISLRAEDITFRITKRYLNLPVSTKVDRAVMTFTVDGCVERKFDIRLAESDPDFWVFCDMSAFKGQTVTVSYDGNRVGMGKIYQNDTIEGQQTMYRETNRPQYHFSTRRGKNGDPNGLLFYEGEYHLFYQHNPYELTSEPKMQHWGHAVSRDLIHWEELPIALYPDRHGAIFSGSAVIDYDNTSGFGKGNIPPMVAIYTAYTPEKQMQCIAYSLDKGRSWTKYDGNPVIDSNERWKSNQTRDPKVFWYQPGNHWVMALFERNGNSIYTSPNLKDWKYESHTIGFWECPELFELPVDGNPANTKWVMYCVSGTYMIGLFDGRTFTPEHGIYQYITGIGAMQTFNNIPASDGRRIQIGNGGTYHPGMPFNCQMNLPTELTLRTTKDGIRLFNEPVKEVDVLQEQGQKWTSLTARQANELLAQYKGKDFLRVKTTIKLYHFWRAGLNLNGQVLLMYDAAYSLVNNVFYSSENRTSMEITADIFIDKNSVEVFIDAGAYSYAIQRSASENNTEGFMFWSDFDIDVTNLEVYPMKSIWK